MIICHKKKFVYLRTVKTGSSSIEIYLSQFCSKKDVISPLFESEEKFKIKNNLPSHQNCILKKKSFGIKNFINLNFYNDVNIYDHLSIDKIFKTQFGKLIKNYFFFSFIRNPYDWIVSYFWWNLFFHKKNKLIDINKFSQKKINYNFTKFLDEKCYNFFEWQKNIITSKNVVIEIFKYEDFIDNLRKIKKELNLNS